MEMALGNAFVVVVVDVDVDVDVVVDEVDVVGVGVGVDVVVIVVGVDVDVDVGVDGWRKMKERKKRRRGGMMRRWRMVIPNDPNFLTFPARLCFDMERHHNRMNYHVCIPAQKSHHAFLCVGNKWSGAGRKKQRKS